MQDLIYRLDSERPFPDSDPQFTWIRHPWQVLTHWRVLQRRFGVSALLRLAAACATPSRAFFFIARDGLPVSHGRVRFGRCEHYEIEPDAAVLGEIWSDAAYRGQGLATRALQGAINALMAAGCRTIYIDTQPHNLPMRRAIDRCGFREHVDPALGAC
jgi:RimJ/RimL family protein N-acetyltransferase